MRLAGSRYFMVGTSSALLILLLAVSTSGCTAADEEYCSSNEDCEQSPGPGDVKYVCHPLRHTCVPFGPDTCFQDEDCLSAAASHCDLASNRCEACSPGDVKDTSCAHLSDKPFCAAAAGGGTACVACLRNLDCPASTPICDGQRCRKCQQHSDCAGTLHCDGGSQCTDSLVCINDDDPGLGSTLGGRCAQNGAKGRVLYVNAALQASCDDSGMNVGQQPFCSLDAAYALASTGPYTYIRVLAADPYLKLSMPITTGQIVFIGAPVPSLEVQQSATIWSAGQPTEVSGTGSLTLDGFTLVAPRTPNATLVRCSGTSLNRPNLTLRNSVLAGSTPNDLMYQGAAAVDLIDCKAKISGNLIGLGNMSQLSDMNVLAHSRGLRVANNNFGGTDSLIENNVIAGNWQMAVDLDAVAVSDVTLRFNTIVGNGRLGSFGGIRCPSTSASVPVLYSIVFHNTGLSQFMSPNQCDFKQVVVGQDEPLMAKGLTLGDPMLDDAFHLTAASMFCIDKAVPGMNETFPVTDIQGQPRPQGMGWDLGAYEFPVGR